MRYAIPAQIDDDLARGRVVVFNGSRKALPEIVRPYPKLLVLMITAPADVLAQRLRARGREHAGEIVARLGLADLAPPEGAQVIVNDSTPEAAVKQIEAAITRAVQTV